MEKLVEENKEYREVVADPTLELKKSARQSARLW